MRKPTDSPSGHLRMLKVDLRTRSVPSVEKGLQILEIIAESTQGLTLSELVKKSRLPRSSIYCLVLTLERKGYLRRAKHRFMLAMKIFPLASNALTHLEIRRLATPYLYGLMQATKLTVHLAVMEEDQAIVVEKIEAPGMLKIPSWVGRRMDVHCTGVGKAFMANLDEPEIDRLIREHGLPRHNDNTVSSSPALKAQLAEVRKRMYAIDDEEDEIGLRCIGAPIFSDAGEALAAISLCGTVRHISTDNLRVLAEKLTRTASEISRSLKKETT